MEATEGGKSQWDLSFPQISLFCLGYSSRSCEYVNVMWMVTVMSSVPVKVAVSVISIWVCWH